MNHCPVCASPRTGSGAGCPGCGFSLAFAEAFSSPEARAQWEAEVARRVQQHRAQSVSGRTALTVLERQIACAENGSVRRFSAAGDAQIIANAVQISQSRTHELILMENGRVKAGGSNRMGQCMVQDIRNAAFVLAGPNVSYIVTREGRVLARGVCAFAEEIAGWRDIETLACGDQFLAGLTKSGRMYLAAAPGAPFRINGPWEDIRSIAAADDYLIALANSGIIRIAGRRDDEACLRAMEWRNVVAVAAEDMYAVGLTRDGRVLLAGEGGWLDRGRSKAAEWTNITAIAAGHGAIAAVDANGRLHIAGDNFATLAGRERLIAQWTHG